MQLPGSPPPDETSHFTSEVRAPNQPEPLKTTDNQHQQNVPHNHMGPEPPLFPACHSGSVVPAGFWGSEERKPWHPAGYPSHQATSNGTMGSNQPFTPPTHPLALAPTIPHTVQDPNQAKLWEAIAAQYRRPPNSNIPTHFSARPPPVLPPGAIPAAPGHPSDIELVQRWKAIGDYYRSLPSGRHPMSHPVPPGPPMPPTLRLGTLPPEAIQDLELAMRWMHIGDQHRRGLNRGVPGISQPLPPRLPPCPAPTMPGRVQDQAQVELWKAIAEQYRRGLNDTGNPAQIPPKSNPDTTCSAPPST